MKPQCQGPWAPAVLEASLSDLTLCAEGPGCQGLSLGLPQFLLCKKKRTDSVAAENPDRLHLGLQIHSGSSTHREEARKEKGSEQQPSLRVEGVCVSFSLPTPAPIYPRQIQHIWPENQRTEPTSSCQLGQHPTTTTTVGIPRELFTGTLGTEAKICPPPQDCPIHTLFLLNPMEGAVSELGWGGHNAARGPGGSRLPGWRPGLQHGPLNSSAVWVLPNPLTPRTAFQKSLW